MARRRALGCRRAGDGVLIVAAPRPALDTLALLGLRVRPFGSTCVFSGYRCTAGIDDRDQFPSTTHSSRPALERSLTGVLTAVAHGDPAAVERGVNRQTVVPRIRHQLARTPRQLRVTRPGRTGPTTARAAISLGSKRIVPDLLFVRIEHRWRLANRSLCTLARVLRTTCVGPYRFVPD